jgi:hypothetical protein
VSERTQKRMAQSEPAVSSVSLPMGSTARKPDGRCGGASSSPVRSAAAEFAAAADVPHSLSAGCGRAVASGGLSSDGGGTATSALCSTRSTRCGARLWTSHSATCDRSLADGLCHVTLASTLPLGKGKTEALERALAAHAKGPSKMLDPFKLDSWIRPNFAFTF